MQGKKERKGLEDNNASNGRDVRHREQNKGNSITEKDEIK